MYNNNTVTDAGMVRCLNDLCPTNKLIVVLRRHNLTRNFKGREIAVDPTSNSFTAKDGTKVTGGYEILAKLCTKDGKYNRDLHVAVEVRMIKIFTSYMEMCNMRREFGHIGFLVELSLDPVEAHNIAFNKVAKNDSWDAIMDATEPDFIDTLHIDPVKECCPYCGSHRVIANRGRIIEDDFDVEDPKDLNPECDSYMMEVKPVMDRHWEWVKGCNLDKKDMMYDLQELWDAREAEAFKAEVNSIIGDEYLPHCLREDNEPAESNYVCCVV